MFDVTRNDKMAPLAIRTYIETYTNEVKVLLVIKYKTLKCMKN